MIKDTKLPIHPPRVYPAPPPAYDAHYDYESQQLPPQRARIQTWSDTKREWRYGSKSRVFKYYLGYALAGFIIGAIIGIIIAVIRRFT
jgi:hypothetical protein